MLLQVAALTVVELDILGEVIITSMRNIKLGLRDKRLCIRLFSHLIFRFGLTTIL